MTLIFFNVHELGEDFRDFNTAYLHDIFKESRTNFNLMMNVYLNRSKTTGKKFH